MKSGNVFTLFNGEYRAMVVSVGAGLCSLTFRGKNLIIPHPENDIAKAHLGKVLAPWPNRLNGGHYSFKGQEYQLPVNEISTLSALHGLIAWKEWDVVSLSSHSLTLSTPVTPIYGYPFEVRATATYTLKAIGGLSVTLSLTNVGEEEAPAGLGQHPYFCMGFQTIDTLTLQLPCKEAYTVNKRMIPEKLCDVKSLGLDFTQPRVIRDTRIDHTFKTSGSVWQAHLSDGIKTLTLTSDAPYLQVYSAEKLDRKGLAMEPMTCPPDAFNSKTVLQILKPGETQSLHYTVSYTEDLPEQNSAN